MTPISNTQKNYLQKIRHEKYIIFLSRIFCSWAFCFYGKSLPDVAGLILSFSAALLKLQKLWQNGPGSVIVYYI